MSTSGLIPLPRLHPNLTLDVEAAKAEHNRLWREKNSAANAAYTEELAREGLPLAPYRTF